MSLWKIGGDIANTSVNCHINIYNRFGIKKLIQILLDHLSYIIVTIHTYLPGGDSLAHV